MQKSQCFFSALYYDKEGLLPFVERSSSGIRMFKECDYEWLQVINCLKKTGMPLKDIKDFIYMAMEGDKTIDERLQLFLKQKEIIENQIAELQDTLNTINFKCWYYQTAKVKGSTSVPRNMSIEEIPEQFREVRNKLRRFN
ncbi:MAG: MerR family transcriptional regulator [Clostridia bacterium]|nr:MerR family transcriptional regulator [Clostridia bacterium]